MTAINTYAFLNAKVRAMRSNLMSTAFYKSMIEAYDQQDLYQLLIQSRFRNRIEQLGYHDAQAIECQLLLEEIDQLNVIRKYAKDPVKSFVHSLLERYDSEKVKTLLRCWHHKGASQFQPIREKIVADIPIDLVLNAPDLETIGTLLLTTPFGKSILAAASDYKSYQTLFPVELALDRGTFQRLVDVSSGLKRKDKHIVRRLLGIEIDIKNLGWIGRFKSYYDLSAAEIMIHLLPQGYRLSMDHIRKILAGGSLQEALVEVLKGTQLRIPVELDDTLALDTMERFLYEILLYEAKRAFSDFPFSIGAVLGYFYLMRIETKNIRTLFQAKGYALTAEQTESLLVY